MSSLLDWVLQGETIVIRRHNRPVAELAPVPAAVPAAKREIGLLQPEFAQSFQLLSIRLTMAGSLLLSISFIAVQRLGLVRRETLLDLGIVFQVGIAFAIAMFETAIP